MALNLLFFIFIFCTAMMKTFSMAISLLEKPFHTDSLKLVTTTFNVR